MAILSSARQQRSGRERSDESSVGFLQPSEKQAYQFSRNVSESYPIMRAHCCVIYFFFPLALQPNSGLGRLHFSY
jgi:hypothetical protein